MAGRKTAGARGSARFRMPAEVKGRGTVTRMGRHYVPQRYLRNFEVPERPGFIWLHDKQSRKSHLAPIAKVAQSKNYYSPDVEEALRQVEGLANAVIAKLLTNESVSVVERFSLTLYIATMIKRVPYRRRKFMELYPGVLKNTVDEVREEITRAATGAGLDDEWLARRMDELETARTKLEGRPPDNIVEEMREPWPSPDMLAAIFRMPWRVLVTGGPTFFMTSDNPVFFFDAYGLGTPDAEISFPLSPTHALHGCWQPAASPLIFLDATERLVREINRRVASTTGRLAFSHQNAEWIMPTLQKPNPYLSRIIW
jgi:hypothetical protein